MALKEISRAIRIRVPPHFVRSSETFLVELMKWNRTMNLISRADERRVVGRHLLDSLCLLSVEPHLSGKRLLDVGSGAGFPGVVLAIWEPDACVFLLESKSKKVAFLKAVQRRLALRNLSVVHSRIEDLGEIEDPGGMERMTRPIDILVSRGVRGVLALVSSLGYVVAEGGLIVLYKGPRAALELKENKEDARLKERGFELSIVKPAWKSLTTLVVLRKSTTSQSPPS